jgi:imidazolonepropionase-like amidohydrolase
MTKRVGVMLCVAMLAAGACFTQMQAQAPAANVIAVKAGRVLDVKTGKYLTQQIIWIEDDKIKSVGNAADLEKRLPAGAKMIDLSNATVLPGLIDCHVHLTFDPGDTGYRGLSISIPREALIGAKNARATLEAGFTTVRNMAATGYADIALRDAINAGDVPGPRILASGPPLSITGGHGDGNLLAPEFHASHEGVANGVPGVMAKTRENIKYGADVIKFMASGGVLSQGDNPQNEQFSPEEMRAIITEAHRLGRKVAAHAHGAQAIKDAVASGVDSIEHGTFIDEEGIQLMKQHGTYLVPTLFLGDWLLENMTKIGLTPNMMEKARAVIPARTEHIGRAFREGVKVAFGTDAAVYPHGLNAGEFGVMVKMGLTPLQAVQTATVNAADLLGWSDRVGTLESGKFADLIAVDGDPLQDVTVLTHVRFVMKGGEVIKNR